MNPVQIHNSKAASAILPSDSYLPLYDVTSEVGQVWKKGINYVLLCTLLSCLCVSSTVMKACCS
jgi:hypothetical protein